MKYHHLGHEVLDLLIIRKEIKWSKQTTLLDGYFEDTYRKDRLQVHPLPEQQVAWKSEYLAD